jgi:hypothetical protein
LAKFVNVVINSFLHNVFRECFPLLNVGFCWFVQPCKCCLESFYEFRQFFLRNLANKGINFVLNNLNLSMDFKPWPLSWWGKLQPTRGVGEEGKGGGGVRWKEKVGGGRLWCKCRRWWRVMKLMVKERLERGSRHKIPFF